jgi:hypothetical protein
MNASRDTSTHTNILSYAPAPNGTLEEPREFVSLSHNSILVRDFCSGTHVLQGSQEAL